MSTIEQVLLSIINKHLFENGIISEDDFKRVEDEIQNTTNMGFIDKEKELLI